MIIFLSLGASMWFLGYYVTARKMSNPGKGTDMERIVCLPTWLYFLCGAPIAKGYPRGTIKVGVFMAQMQGLAFVLYAIIAYLWKPSRTEFLIGLALSAALPLITTYFVSNNYVVSDRALKRKRNK